MAARSAAAQRQRVARARKGLATSRWYSSKYGSSRIGPAPGGRSRSGSWGRFPGAGSTLGMILVAEGRAGLAPAFRRISIVVRIEGPGQGARPIAPAPTLQSGQGIEK